MKYAAKIVPMSGCMNEPMSQRINTSTHTRISSFLMFLCSCAVMLLCSPVSVRAKTLPETAKLLPPETILLVDIDNFNQFRTRFEKTKLYKLYKDPAMAAFVDDFKSKWREKIHQLDNEFIRVVIEADALPQGRVAVALVLNPPTAETKNADELPLLFITQWGQATDKIKEAVDKMAQKAIEDGAYRKTEDYRGVSITTITGQSSADVSYCFIDETLIESMNPDVLKFVIAHIKGAGSPTLADDTDYATTIKSIGPSAPGGIHFYINIKQIVKTVIAEDNTDKTKTIITNLGLDNVTSLGCSIGSDAGEGFSFGKTFLKIEGRKKGICKMLDIESATFRAPQFISASACTVSFVNLNIHNAYNELANILTSFSPQFAAMMYMPLLPPSPQGEPPLQLKADIIDHLGSQIITAQSKPLFNAGARPSTESLVAVVVNDSSALEKSLSFLHSRVIAPNNPDARCELLGHTIYLVDLPTILPVSRPGERTPMQAPARPGAPKMPKLAFAVTDTHLIFASESVVEQAIRALSSTGTVSVGSANWFKKAKSAVPSVVGLASLQDNAASGESFWSVLRGLKQSGKKGKAKDSGIKMGVGTSPGSVFLQLMFSRAGSDLFKFSLLPEFDAVRKYFGLSVFYGISRPDGFFFEFKYLDSVNN
ncbi:MAG: DUF3352 domain-containing protein [Planctomycetota bacterium]